MRLWKTPSFLQTVAEETNREILEKGVSPASSRKLSGEQKQLLISTIQNLAQSLCLPENLQRAKEKIRNICKKGSLAEISQSLRAKIRCGNNTSKSHSLYASIYGAMLITKEHLFLKTESPDHDPFERLSLANVASSAYDYYRHRFEEKVAKRKSHLRELNEFVVTNKTKGFSEWGKSAYLQILSHDIAYDQLQEGFRLPSIAMSKTAISSKPYEYEVAKVLHNRNGLVAYLLTCTQNENPPLLIFQGTDQENLSQWEETIVNTKARGESAYGDAEHKAVTKLLRGQKAIAAGHSLGGLIARSAVINYQKDFAEGFTFNSPHSNKALYKQWRDSETPATITNIVNSRDKIAKIGGRIGIGSVYLAKGAKAQKELNKAERQSFYHSDKVLLDSSAEIKMQEQRTFNAIVHMVKDLILRCIAGCKKLMTWVIGSNTGLYLAFDKYYNPWMKGLLSLRDQELESGSKNNSRLAVDSIELTSKNHKPLLDRTPTETEQESFSDIKKSADNLFSLFAQNQDMLPSFPSSGSITS